MKKKLRPLGTILLELEPLLDEMVHSHDLQMGDILALIHSYLEVHSPNCKEEYVDSGENPEFFYGPRRKK